MRICFVWLCLVALTACTKESPPTTPSQKPDWEVRYERVRGEADAAFAAEQYARAAELYRSATDALPQTDSRRRECEERWVSSRYLDSMRKTEEFAKDGKFQEAIFLVESARKILPPGDPRIPDTDRAIQRLRSMMLTAAGQKKMAEKDWVGAAKDFASARLIAPEAEREELRELEGFCRRFAEANQAYLVKKDLPVAQSLYEELLKNPRSFEKEILEKLDAVKAQMERDVARREALTVEFQKSFEAGQAFFARAEWAKAKEALEKAEATGLTSPEFETLLQRARQAASPPDGFVFISRGKFLLGDGPAASPTGPQQEVETGDYYIGRREVTNAEYAKFLDAATDHSSCHETEPESKNHRPEGWSDSLDPSAPVTGVDWYDAWAYAKWAGGRLPTEAEWEKAAGWSPQSDEKLTYPWGAEFVSMPVEGAEESGPEEEELPEAPADATSRGPSPWGVEGLANDVLEWVADWYGPYPGGKALDLSFGETRRVARGGVRSEDFAAEDLKTSRRFRFLPDRRDRHLGIRIVKSVE